MKFGSCHHENEKKFWLVLEFYPVTRDQINVKKIYPDADRWREPSRFHMISLSVFLISICSEYLYWTFDSELNVNCKYDATVGHAINMNQCSSSNCWSTLRSFWVKSRKRSEISKFGSSFRGFEWVSKFECDFKVLSEISNFECVFKVLIQVFKVLS